VTVPEVRYSAVFNVEPCPVSEPCPDHPNYNDQGYWVRCVGCLGDGTRVDLSNGIPVERRTVEWEDEGIERALSCWVEVSDLKEASDG
jgi:hypothetical protein